MRTRPLFIVIVNIILLTVLAMQNPPAVNAHEQYLIDSIDKKIDELEHKNNIPEIKHSLESIPQLEKNTSGEETAIIQLQKPMSKAEINRMIGGKGNLKIRYVFEHIFYGFSVQGPTQEIKKLHNKTKAIQNVYPSYMYKLSYYKFPSFKNNHLTNSINFIGTEKIRHMKDKRGNKLTGKGIKVGIIDTGIDYTHPDLRKAYKKGWDFVDNDPDPMETINLGPYNTLHGTHVAGVIAANGFMTGMAPDAEIYAYRALGPGGFGTTEQIIAAIEQAIKDKVDVLNLSLGININGPDLPTSKALDAAVQNGIVAVTSNGNSGPGLWTVGSPGTSHRAISVGASTPEMNIPYLDYYQELFRLNPLYGSVTWQANETYKLEDGGIGCPNDLKNAKGKLAIIKRGKLTFTEKAENAKQAGAKAVLIYNNVDGELLAELEKEIDIPVAAISKKGGETLLNLAKANETLARVTYKKEKDVLAQFSSRGPVTYTWDIKPDILAPGVAITSTVPGGYLPLQGTSMAAPHVAGAGALLKQAHPELTPVQIKAILMNTSKLLTKEGEAFYESFEQGAGRIQMEEALKADSIVQPGALLYGKRRGAMFDETKKTITVENISDQTIRYTFSVPERSGLINWHFPAPFYLKPNEKKKVTIGMEVKANHKRNQIYNGYIKMQANSRTIDIPYLYVVNEPNYPRILAFSFAESDRPDLYQYEVYLPGGADEFGIALFDPDTHQFINYLAFEEDVMRGLISKELKLNGKVAPGIYIAVAFAKKEKREDYMEQLIEIK